MRNFKKYMAVMLASVALVHSTNNAFAAEWLLHTGTKLEEAKNNFDFCTGDYNNDGKLDIYAIKKSKTGTGSTEIHILNGADNYQSFLLQTATKLEEARSNFDFCVGDYNKDGKLDVYAIKKNATGTGTTEVHILNGANAYQSFLLQTGISLEKAEDKFDFCVGDYNRDGKSDIYALKKSETGTSSMEVHILNGADNYQSFLLHTGTKLEEPKTKYEFGIGDYNGDGKDDIYALKKSATGTLSTEIHILNGDNNYQSFLLQTGTKLEEAGDIFSFCVGDYNQDDKIDLYALKKRETGTASTEVHVLTIDGSKGKSTTNNNTSTQTKTNTTEEKTSNNVHKTMTNALYQINTTASKLTCGFDGYTTTSGRHEGIDFASGYGKKVYSLTDGVITKVTYGKEGSNGLSTIAIYNAATNKTVIYLHTAPLSSLKVGQTITRGTQIATESWRGCSKKSGTHTHVEVRNGKKTSAAKSVNDYTLDNSNPTSFWNSLGYQVR